MGPASRPWALLGKFLSYITSLLGPWAVHPQVPKSPIGWIPEIASIINELTSMYTHFKTPFLPLTDSGMSSTQSDPLCHSVYLLSDH
ncbi:hypothetical protein DSO57_1036071 [Entomophthora muscae]|uniref:Uncharacterized protein n=1 Tax=Entomophthora muscae TaxID=34485 RepID=A0ACC2UJY1_9FUNG|nr:hypothetical protein DSO57_1036071 [Entomophthora muscae]